MFFTYLRIEYVLFEPGLLLFMVGINNLSVEFSAKPLFDNVSFTINKNDKLALVGKNGAGKSTLLKIIAGLQTPMSGVIALPSEITIGYLPQEMKTFDDRTLIEETKKAFTERLLLEKKLHNINKEIQNSTDFESEEYFKLISDADELRHNLELRFPENLEAETERILIGLGFQRSDFNRLTSEFSGGWRMRIELAKILLKKPDLLLLDEPTNHLDINSIQWLEQFLKTNSSAVVLVSHDRAFLDNVTSRTIEISCGKIYDYNVSFTPFENLRKERIEQQLKAYVNQQKLIQDTKDFIERFRYKATKAVQVQSRIKQLEKIIPIEIDANDTSSINFKFPPAERSGDFPLTIENVSKNYGDHTVFSNVSLSMRRGEKIAFVGRNGEGKSTLVKCIMQEILFSGYLKIGHNVRIAYFAQNQAQKLDPEISVFDTVDKVATGEIRTRLKDLLAAFLFRGEEIEKKVKVLSGGEKTRLSLAKLLLEPANFLILDEPTNHLDMRTKEVLKRALKEFNGSLIIVSHDRDFLDGLVDKVYEFADGKVREYIGGIYDYLNHKNPDNTLLSQKNPSSIDKTQVGNSQKNSLTYAEKKEFEKLVRKVEKNIEEIENKITKIEREINALEIELMEGYNSSALNKYTSKKQELETATEDWEKAQLELENLKTKKYEK